ncbi:hypothetical protein [Bacterioplanoides pacificum]|uniref:Uncharacterized protein n=1 Tax=Bacterioplanoides pacificum TaxID=1171596 RepID=A0ABV7VTI4_9GAMM
MGKDVQCAVNDIKECFVREARCVTVPDAFIFPGYWCVFVAYGHSQNYPFDYFDIPKSLLSYAQAVKFPEALGGEDTYPYIRCNEGQNYSAIAHIRGDGVDSSDGDVESANEMLASVIKRKLPDETLGKRALLKAIGELHDNVSSHGSASGFSMAQFYKANSYYPAKVNFAVVDAGIGLLEELQRQKIQGVTTHQEAIAWCIQKGNSSKKVDGEWVQRLPADATHSPFGDGVETTNKDNHHQGLGLHHFVKLVKDFGGSLQLATGNCLLLVDNSGAESYINLSDTWKGVAISCTLPVNQLTEDRVEVVPENIQSIMDKLRA